MMNNAFNDMTSSGASNRLSYWDHDAPLDLWSSSSFFLRKSFRCRFGDVENPGDHSEGEIKDGHGIKEMIEDEGNVLQYRINIDDKAGSVRAATLLSEENDDPRKCEEP